MQLLFHEEVIGIIRDQSNDGPEMWGSFEPNDAAIKFTEMWNFMADEDNWDKDPPVSEDYLEDSNWSILEDAGTRRQIFLPAVYPDGSISWHWRID